MSGLLDTVDPAALSDPASRSERTVPDSAHQLVVAPARFAERGLALLRANPSDHRRGRAFGPEQPVPDGADAYQRIAAFAGRRV